MKSQEISRKVVKHCVRDEEENPVSQNQINMNYRAFSFGFVVWLWLPPRPDDFLWRIAGLLFLLQKLVDLF